MARMVNSFALLDDEEGEDMSVLVENVAKKVEVTVVDPVAVVDKKPPPPKQSNNQQGNGKGAAPPSEYVRSERGRGRGGRGRGAGRGAYGGNDSEHFGNEQDNGNRRSYWDESKGNGYDDANRGRGRNRGGGRGRGRGRFNSEHVIREEKESSGDNKNNVEDSADGWEQVPQTHSRGYGNYVSNKDEERSYRNENRNYGGERRGYAGGNHHGSRGRRDGMNYGSRVEEANKDEVKEHVNGADGNDVDGAPDVAVVVAEGDVAAVTEETKDLGAEEKVQEESVKVENPVKKQEEEDENLMTLEEYEKLYAEKRKALEAQKIEVRKVTADKDFEAMQLLEKKKEEILLKPETAKLKKKDSLEKDEKSRKTLSINEFLKPADGEAFFYRRPGRGRGRGAGRGGDSGDFRNGERGARGGEFRSGGGRGGDFRGGERGGRGGDFRSGERAFRNNGYSRRDGPNIHIEDQSQFPVLKGAAAPAVEAA
ncbi:hypothetical protein V2J09_022003 [Rumex salicifolius]